MMNEGLIKRLKGINLNGKVLFDVTIEECKCVPVIERYKKSNAGNDLNSPPTCPTCYGLGHTLKESSRVLDGKIITILTGKKPFRYAISSGGESGLVYEIDGKLFSVPNFTTSLNALAEHLPPYLDEYDLWDTVIKNIEAIKRAENNYKSYVVAMNWCIALVLAWADRKDDK